MALRREIRVVEPPPKLEKNEKIVEYNLGPSKLYLDDIRLIYQRLLDSAISERSADSGDGKADPPVGIFVSGAIADAPEDLRDATPKELRRVSIISTNLGIGVFLGSQYTSKIEVWSPSKGDRIASAIRDFVNGKRSFRGAFDNRFIWLGLASAQLILILNAPQGAKAPIHSNAWHPFFEDCLTLEAITAGAIIAFGLLTYWCRLLPAHIRNILSSKVYVVPHMEAEVRGLSSETRKQLLIALAGAVLGGLIVGLATLWAGVAVHH
jgi:hypothetical protein